MVNVPEPLDEAGRDPLSQVTVGLRHEVDGPDQVEGDPAVATRTRPEALIHEALHDIVAEVGLTQPVAVVVVSIEGSYQPELPEHRDIRSQELGSHEGQQR